LYQGLKVAGGDLAGVQALGFSDGYLNSEITANDGDQRKFALVTDTAGYPDTAWNVFIEYTNFLLNRADPDSAGEVPSYGDASAVLTEMAELADKGDEPPYSSANNILETVGGTPQTRDCTIVLQGTLDDGISTRQQVNQSIVVNAPLGLIWVRATANFSETVPELLVEALPGNYKGVKADRIYAKDKLLGF